MEKNYLPVGGKNLSCGEERQESGDTLPEGDVKQQRQCLHVLTSVGISILYIAVVVVVAVIEGLNESGFVSARAPQSLSVPTAFLMFFQEYQESSGQYIEWE